MIRRLVIAALLWFCALPALAEGRYASIIIDADSLDILHARQIDASRHPASLTKIMTLHLTFEAIDQGRLTLDQSVTVSRNAARTPPVKMGLRAGQSVRIDTLVQAVAVRSHNDAAVVLAETLAGSEAAFAQRMNAKARELGMQNTVFRNANGLPDDAQVTTARDMAKLAHATLARFPQHYHYFGQTEFRGRKNTNGLLPRADVDGFKTGYTRASGYNLVISGTRAIAGETRRIIAVVLGGASKDSRNQHMGELVDRGFDVIAKTGTRRVVRHTPPPKPAATILAATPTRPVRWAVQIGGFASPAEAEIAAAALSRHARSGTVVPHSGFAGGQPVHSARVEDLEQAEARQLCAEHSAILSIPARRCRVLSTGRAGT